MPCDNLDVPKYLIYFPWKKTFHENQFKNKQYLYRIGFKESSNPIEFPKTLTAISVSWSNLILRRHVLKISPLTLGDNLYYSSVKEVRNCCVEQICTEGEYAGLHQLKTIIKHRPIPCNYSHAEILIQQFYPENGELKSTIIEHEDWGKSLLKKFKGGPRKEFFKLLELDYRASMATILHNDCKELDFTSYLKIFPKNLILRLNIFLNMVASR